MNIKKNITIHLSEGDVKEIIADYLRKEGYSVEADNVRLIIGSRTVGYFMDEYDEHYFKEASVLL